MTDDLQDPIITAPNSHLQAAAIDAIKCNQVDAVRRLVGAGADIGLIDGDQLGGGASDALSFASSHGHLEMVKALVEMGAPTNLEYAGASPLSLAVKGKHLPVVEYLLEHGANPEDIRASSVGMRLQRSNAALALIEGQPEMFKLIAKHMIARDQRGLLKGRTGPFRPIDVDPGLSMSIYGPTDRESTLLEVLIYLRQDRTDLIELLLDSGVNINERNLHSGYTGLHTAVLTDKVAIVKLLLDRGADVECESNSGVRPIHLACHQEAFASLKVLVEHGANLYATDSNGNNALHLCSSKFGKEKLVMIDFLVKSGLDVNQPNRYGETALHLAVLCDKAELIEKLVTLGAEIDAMSDGRTPLMMALPRDMSQPYTESARALLALGADPTLPALSMTLDYVPKTLMDALGQSRLMNAVRSMSMALVSNRMGDGVVDDTEFKEALRWVSKSKNPRAPEIARFLQAHGARRSMERVLDDRNSTIAQLPLR